MDILAVIYINKSNNKSSNNHRNHDKGLRLSKVCDSQRIATLREGLRVDVLQESREQVCEKLVCGLTSAQVSGFTSEKQA